jgi:integrase
MTPACLDVRGAAAYLGDTLFERRVRLHLLPYFGVTPLAAITADMVRAYVAQRKQATFKGRLYTPAQINRELQTLKAIFSLAMKDGRIAQKPYIPLLEEDNVRRGLFEPEQYRSVLKHLPEELQPVVTFAYITGWRLADEVLPLEWRQVDVAGGEVRLDAGTTKNREGRVFPLTQELRAVLDAQQVQARQSGHVVPWVFFRMVAQGRGGAKRPMPIRSITKAWKLACRAAGCPGRLPHDLRRTAVRNLVRAGVPERVAMQMTGHKTRSVFERYNIVSPGDLRSAARLLDAALPAVTSQ